VHVLDARTGMVRATIPVRGGQVSAIAVDEQTGQVLVGAGRTLSALDVNTGAVRRTFRMGSDIGALAVASTLGRIFVYDMGNETVTMFDARTGVRLHATHLGSVVTEMAVTDRARRVYVTDTGGFDVLDARSGTLLRAIHIGSYPYTVPAFDEHKGRTFVVSSGPCARKGRRQGIGVSVLDTTTATIRSTIAVNPPPYPIAIGAPLIMVVTDEHSGRVFISNAVANTVSVVDTRSS